VPMQRDDFKYGQKRGKTWTEPGLGVVDFSVEVHYKDTLDNDLLEQSKDHKIYAIPERTALIVEGEKLSEFGDSIYLFENGQKIKFENNENREFKNKINHKKGKQHGR